MTTAVNLEEFAVRGDKEGNFGRGGAWGYWRMPNGYITRQPVSPTEFMRQMRPGKGFVPLMEYGDFVELARDPFQRILSMGGAKEFCLAQIRELGWDMKPPQGITFPQLAGVETARLECSTCRKKYLTLDDLQNHEQVAHRDLSSNKLLGRQLAEATSGVLSGPMADAFKLLATAVTGIAEQTAATASRQATSDELLTKLIEQLSPAPATVPTEDPAKSGGSPRR